MVEEAVKVEIESRCGIECSKCVFKQDNKCAGCTNIQKPFWGDVCPIKVCCEQKQNVKCCGECSNFPCELLKKFAYDKEQGDNGLRIKTCAKWCHKEINEDEM